MTLVDAHFAFRVLPAGAGAGGGGQSYDEAGSVILLEVKRIARRLPSFPKEVVDDAVGDTIVKLLKNPPARPLESDDHVRAFIYVVLRRTCISIIRRLGRSANATDDPEDMSDPKGFVGSIDVDDSLLTSQLATYTNSLQGVNRSAALELLAIHEGKRTFEDVLQELAKAEGLEPGALDKLRARKHTQYKRAKAALAAALHEDRTLRIWDRTLLLYKVGGLGLSNDRG